MNLTTAEHPTPLGTMWSRWTDRGLYSLLWDAPADSQHDSHIASLGNITQIAEFSDQLEAFFRTGRESFADVVIDASGWTEFTSRVYDCCRTIEPGKTVTYKQLARLAGNENASRAVGAAMSRNRILLVIPCHRVISGGGQLRGFSAPGGLATKRQLLELEQRGHMPATLFAGESA